MHQDDLTFDVLMRHGADTNQKQSDLDLPVIHLAAHYANLHVVDKLLRQNRNLASGIHDLSQTTPLHQLLLQNKDLLEEHVFNSSYQREETTFQIAKLLIDATSWTNNGLNKQDHARKTALHIAVACGNTDVAKYLLHEQSIDFALKDSNEYTAFDYAISNKNVEMVKAFFDKGVDCGIGNENLIKILKNDYRDLDFNQILFAAVTYKRLSQFFSASIFKLLIEKGIDINIKNNQGETILMKAIQCHHPEIAKILIENGAYINAVSNNGITVLEQAAHNGDLETVRLLIEKGAVINVKHKSCATALMIAAYNASKKGYYCLEIVRLLIESGAEVNARDNDGETALFFSIGYNCIYELETVRLLIEKRVDINARNNDGETALMKAVRFNQPKTVSLLIRSGADVSIRNNDGQTALDIACPTWFWSPRQEIIDLLYKHSPSSSSCCLQ